MTPVRAVDLLGARDSAALRVRLLPVLPERVPVRPVPSLLRWAWPRWVAAMATPWAVYVRSDVLAGDPAGLADVLCHELVHVRQWRTLGYLGFLRRYIVDYLRGRGRGLSHRQAYQAIGLEVEAQRIQVSP